MHNDFMQFMGVQERIARPVRELKEQLIATADQLARYNRVEEAVTKLRDSWRITDDDHHYLPFWFFVKQFALNPHGQVTAYEAFGPIEVVSDRAAALAMRPHQLGEFKDCAHVGCKLCKEPVPVVGKLLHSGEYPGEPSWRLDLYALCGSCVELTDVASAYKTSPMCGRVIGT